MTKSIYPIVLILFGYMTVVYAMEDSPNSQTKTLSTSHIANVSNSQNLTTNDQDEIDDEYVKIGKEAYDIIIPPDQKGLVNSKTIVSGIRSSWYQYGTGEMEKYDLEYNKLVTEAIKIYIENYRYLLKYLELSSTGTAQLFIGSTLFSYTTLVILSYIPAICWNVFLENITPLSPYVGSQSLFDDYHLIYQCNNIALFNLALLCGILIVNKYNTTLKAIDRFLDRFPTENDVWDLKSKGIPISQKQLLHSIDKDICKNPLVFQLYPDALDMKAGRERSTGTIIAKVTRGISNLNKLYINKKSKELEYDIPTLKEIGKYNFWRIMKKINERKELSITEQENYNAVINFPLFRHEIGLTRLWNEPINLLVIFRKLCGFRYIFDKNEAQITADISNIDKVIQMISTTEKIPYMEDQIFNQDIKTQKIIAIFASNAQLKEELENYNTGLFVEDAQDTISDIDKTKLFLASLI